MIRPQSHAHLSLTRASTFCIAGVTLSLGTQASTKVYRKKPDGAPSQQLLMGSIEEDALLVYTPDPLVPFARSAYVGNQRFELSPGGSLIAVDWLSSGRAICGERWAFDSYLSRTEVCLRDDKGAVGAPAIVEALSLPQSRMEQRAMGFDLGGVARDAAVSIVVTGPRTEQVVSRLHDAAAIIAQRRSGGDARDAREGRQPSVLKDGAAATATSGETVLTERLLGDMMLGVCDVDVPTGGEGGGAVQKVTVARLVAEHNEDVYRLVHFCLSPLGHELGVTPYTDRIHATVAAPPAVLDAVQKAGGRTTQNAGGEIRAEKWRRAPVVPAVQPEAEGAHAGSAATPATMHEGLSHQQVLRIMHLCDTTLPTGGFAHSGGLEAALQFGLLGRGRPGPGMLPALRDLGTAAALSTVQMQAPFALAAHALVEEALPRLLATRGLEQPQQAWPADDVEAGLSEAMAALNAQQHALISANAPACRASLLQGSTLSRIAVTWVGGSTASKVAGSEAAAAARGVHILPARHGHGAPALGALAALLGLPARTVVDALLYMTVRDFFSAAVRLNLVGPLAAVSLQSDVVGDAASCSSDVMELTCAHAAGAAPLLEAAHACHDLLERRIFNT